MRFAATIEVHLLEGVADPQGATVERALPDLGFAGVSDVRVGKLINLVVEAPDESAARAEVTDMCARFLTNPVIETASVSVQPAGN